MAFLKALTVFIICISIFKIIILESTTVGKKNNLTNYNVLLKGYLKCEDCGVNDVTVILYEKDKIPDILYANCSRGSFLYSRYLKNPNPEDYKATFAHVCNGSMVAKVEKKAARFIATVFNVYTYDFGFIDLKRKTKKSKKR